MKYPWFNEVHTQLESSFQGKRFHHAQLFIGLEGTGKSEYVNELAEGLLCRSTDQIHGCGGCKSCLLEQANTHPDKLVLGNDTNSIGVDEIRALGEFIFHSAQQGFSKVAVIQQAEKMTTSAANALLKTLEEPAANRFILLTAQSTDKLPATVLSRCNHNLIKLEQGAQANSWLESQGVNLGQYPWAHWYLNQPLLLIKWLESGQMETISSLYDSSLLCHTNEAHDNVAAILAKSPDLTRIFIRFLLKMAQNNLNNDTINFSQYHQITNEIRQYISHSDAVLGLNQTMAINRLLLSIQLILR